MKNNKPLSDFSTDVFDEFALICGIYGISIFRRGKQTNLF